MSDYSLTINIPQGDIDPLHKDGMQITLVKQVSPVVTNASPFSAARQPNSSYPYIDNVAWVVLPPQQQCLVAWTPNIYSLYMTVSPIELETVLTLNVTNDADLNSLYTYQKGAITRYGPYSPAGYYAIENTDANSDALNFGMAQQVSVNESSQVLQPLNVVPVLTNYYALFQPSDTLFVFMASYSESGSVILSSPNATCKVAFSDDEPDITVNYKNGSFSR